MTTKTQKKAAKAAVKTADQVKEPENKSVLAVLAEFGASPVDILRIKGGFRGENP